MDQMIIDSKIGALNARIAELEDKIQVLRDGNNRLYNDNEKLRAELTAALQIIDARSTNTDELQDLKEYTKRLNQDLAETRERAETTRKRLLLMVSELAEISAGGVL